MTPRNSLKRTISFLVKIIKISTSAYFDVFIVKYIAKALVW